MNRIIFFILFLLVIPAGTCFSQDNPFLSKGTKDTEKEVTLPQYPDFIRKLFNTINDFQKELTNNLSTLSKKINEEKDLSLLVLLLGIALFYGFVHGLGPGHGKIVMVSFALSRPLKAWQGIALGGLIAVIHTFSAIVLVSLLYFILNNTYTNFSQEPKKIISLVSYGLIAGMGAFLLIRAVVSNASGEKTGNNGENNVKIAKHGIRDIIIPALIIGLVPCEGAILILIFSISINAFWLGVVMAVAMSAGIAITVSVTGILAIYSKKGVVKLASAGSGAAKAVGIAFQVIGAVIILAFGLLLFFSQL
ncbi:MAG: hypothetical protein JW969_16025 [Spirochaetales bacterium]|nr:hypothetical protein [Spirochaetales bacterium]